MWSKCYNTVDVLWITFGKWLRLHIIYGHLQLQYWRMLCEAWRFLPACNKLRCNNSDGATASQRRCCCRADEGWDAPRRLMGQLQESPVPQVPLQGCSGSHHSHQPGGPIYIGPARPAAMRAASPVIKRLPLELGHRKLHVSLLMRSHSVCRSVEAHHNPDKR